MNTRIGPPRPDLRWAHQPDVGWDQDTEIALCTSNNRDTVDRPLEGEWSLVMPATAFRGISSVGRPLPSLGSS